MHRALALGAMFLTGCATTSSTFYPLTELTALDPTDDRAEILDRARDVAPTQRTDAWRAAVERAAVATLDLAEVKDVSTAEQALALVEAQPAKFPFLARSMDWLAKRADVGVRALPYLSQLGDRRAWVRRVTEFAKKDAKTPHLAQRLAEEVILKQLALSAASELYELAFEREGVALCDDKNVITLTVEMAADGSAWKPALDRCWKQLAGPMTEAAAKSETRTAKLHLCKVMAAHAAEPAVKAACAE
jgi:hypothetical protein